MIQRGIWILLLMSVMGCSAIGLSEQNQQATAQVEAQIAGTVDSQIGIEATAVEENRQEIAVTITALVNILTRDAVSVESQVNGTLTAVVEQTRAAEPTLTPTPDITGTIEQVEITLTLADVSDEPPTADAENTDEPQPDDPRQIVADAEATLTAIANITSEPETTTEPTFIPASAQVEVFGTVPIDTDSLNSITALAFDNDGHILVSLRNGDIYHLIDEDNNNSADDVTLIFEDTDDDIGQVSGLLLEGDLLYVVNGEQLSLLQDDDSDGDYDTITTLIDTLPDNQALLQANNSIIRTSDGRLFTADVSSGDILLITLGE